MANALYGLGKQAILNKEIDLDTDTIKAILLNSSYVPNLVTDQFLSGVTTYRVTGTTDQALTTKSVTLGVFDADDVTFTAVASGSTAKYVGLYRDSGSAATSQLIALFDTITNFPVTTNGGNITVQWDNGAYKIFAL